MSTGAIVALAFFIALELSVFAIMHHAANHAPFAPDENPDLDLQPTA